MLQKIGCYVFVIILMIASFNKSYAAVFEYDVQIPGNSIVYTIPVGDEKVDDYGDTIYELIPIENFYVKINGITVQPVPEYTAMLYAASIGLAQILSYPYVDASNEVGTLSYNASIYLDDLPKEQALELFAAATWSLVGGTATTLVVAPTVCIGGAVPTAGASCVVAAYMAFTAITDGLMSPYDEYQTSYNNIGNNARIYSVGWNLFNEGFKYTEKANQFSKKILSSSSPIYYPEIIINYQDLAQGTGLYQSSLTQFAQIGQDIESAEIRIAKAFGVGLIPGLSTTKGLWTFASENYSFEDASNAILTEIQSELSRVREIDVFDKIKQAEFKSYFINSGWGEGEVRAVIDPENDVEINALVNLNGSNSSSEHTNITSYLWELKAEATSNATLSSTTASSCNFRPDIPGSYTVTLTVKDGNNNSDSTTAIIKAVKQYEPEELVIVDKDRIYIEQISLDACEFEKQKCVIVPAGEIWDGLTFACSKTDLYIFAKEDELPSIKTGHENDCANYGKIPTVSRDFEFDCYDGDGFGDWKRKFYPGDKICFSLFSAEGYSSNDGINIDVNLLKDRDEDGVPDDDDLFPDNPEEQYDSDQDNVGDNSDAFPNDAAASVDEDGDKHPDRWHSGYSAENSITKLTLDMFPDDILKWDCEYEINPTTNTISYVGGPRTISLAASNLCPWSITTDSNWIRIDSALSGNGSATIEYWVNPNDSGSVRNGTITIGTKVFNLMQEKGIECDYTILPKTNLVKTEGGQGEIFVESPTGCSWTVFKNLNWVSVDSGIAGSGNGKVLYTVEANSGGSERSGSIIVNGELHTITQPGEASECSLSIDSTGESFPYSGGSVSVLVTASTSSCSWGVSENPAWITVSKINGTGSGSLTITALPNLGLARSGVINIAGQSIPVSQSPSSTSNSGLVADYPFNGNANDESGNENHGVVNGATLTEDRFGNPNSAYLFDGINDYIDCGNGASLNISGPGSFITMSAWFYAHNNVSRQNLISKGRDYTVNYGYHLNINNNKSRGLYRLTNGNNIVETDDIIKANQWHHVVTTFDGVESKIYIDGHLKNTTTGGGQIGTSSTNLIIGCHSPSPPTWYQFDGVIDDIKIYNRALSASEVSGLYNPAQLNDADNDGIPDYIEDTTCTNTNDADTDDDGILDGVEDKNQDGIVDADETNPCNPDSDNDGIQDGTELGRVLGDVGPDTDTSKFVPDADPTTTTDPLLKDTDNDGFTDWQEDPNSNGRIDEGESNPELGLSMPADIIAYRDNFDDPATEQNWSPMLGQSWDFYQSPSWETGDLMYRGKYIGDLSAYLVAASKVNTLPNIASTGIEVFSIFSVPDSGVLGNITGVFFGHRLKNGGDPSNRDDYESHVIGIRDYSGQLYLDVLKKGVTVSSTPLTGMDRSAFFCLGVRIDESNTLHWGVGDWNLQDNAPGVEYIRGGIVPNMSKLSGAAGVFTEDGGAGFGYFHVIGKEGRAQPVTIIPAIELLLLE